MAINAIESVVQTTGDASGIDETLINTAISGVNEVVATADNLEVYRIAIMEANDSNLNSAIKISNLVKEINTMFTLTTAGVSFTSLDNINYNITIDENNIVPSNIKDNWSSFVFTYHNPASNSNIYTDMKVIPTLSNDYFNPKEGDGTTSGPFNSPDATSEIVLIFVDANKNVIGYAPLSNAN